MNKSPPCAIDSILPANALFVRSCGWVLRMMTVLLHTGKRKGFDLFFKLGLCVTSRGESLRLVVLIAFGTVITLGAILL